MDNSTFKTTFWVHQWIRSAICDSQQPISPIRFPIFETSATALLRYYWYLIPLHIAEMTLWDYAVIYDLYLSYEHCATHVACPGTVWRSKKVTPGGSAVNCCSTTSKSSCHSSHFTSQRTLYEGNRAVGDDKYDKSWWTDETVLRRSPEVLHGSRWFSGSPRLGLSETPEELRWAAGSTRLPGEDQTIQSSQIGTCDLLLMIFKAGRKAQGLRWCCFIAVDKMFNNVQHLSTLLFYILLFKC